MDDEFKREHLQMLVSMANALVGNLDTDGVREIIDGSDVVFGVYQDVTEPEGVGITIIKGELALESIFLLGASLDTNVAAIPCREREEAWALRLTLGDGKTTH